MWDGSAVPLEENLQIASELLDKCAAAHIIMEMEIGVVGGEEDGVVGEMNEKLYTTPEDALATAEVLGLGERGRYILAATFGNVHGVYKPGHVKLRPAVLKEIQDAVGAKYGQRQAVRPGVPWRIRVRARRDQRGHRLRRGQDERRHRHAVRLHPAVAGHMFTNYDGVLKIDGEVGNKKAYDPRTWGKAEQDPCRPASSRM